CAGRVALVSACPTLEERPIPIARIILGLTGGAVLWIIVNRALRPFGANQSYVYRSPRREEPCHYCHRVVRPGSFTEAERSVKQTVGATTFDKGDDSKLPILERRETLGKVPIPTEDADTAQRLGRAFEQQIRACGGKPDPFAH